MKFFKFIGRWPETRYVLSVSCLDRHTEKLKEKGGRPRVSRVFDEPEGQVVEETYI